MIIETQTEDILGSFDLEQQQLHKHQGQQGLMTRGLSVVKSAPFGWFMLGTVTGAVALLAFKPIMGARGKTLMGANKMMSGQKNNQKSAKKSGRKSQDTFATQSQADQMGDQTGGQSVGQMSDQMGDQSTFGSH